MFEYVAHAAGRPVVYVAIALGLSACFVDGTPFDPELCPSEIVIELSPQTVSALTIDLDTLDLSHCTSGQRWSSRRTGPSGFQAGGLLP